MTEQTQNFHVAMTCEGCAKQVNKVLGKLGDKVSKIDTNVTEQRVTVTTTCTPEEILTELKKTGKESSIL